MGVSLKQHQGQMQLGAKRQRWRNFIFATGEWFNNALLCSRMIQK
ncbi:hypothetical protein TOT_030000448 [Theileria orientalis strain Shintoku]|uniref:Uncharacterized protein n=1 Tax=Theileria orientalis strain Shintoku TaxID=869250 RepID=J4D946_THEOR|nr:hypothetical protein TOT_030000448 [Theileria orientalis strain Shintoku]BAM41185.1 hypothetical protein TOT_030000448 [Theileria orientalis strain Shintoku]|eukprot:XP_009691486.1 hypothetical protein TOT_030000448 [Theileria orientalis strain Shintoku]